MFKFMFPFFQVGYLLSAVRFTPVTGQRKNVLFVFAAAITATAYVLWENKTYIYGSGMVLTVENIPIIALRLVAGLAGSVLIMMLLHRASALVGGGVRGAVAMLGRDSLYVYILQTYFFVLFNRVSWKLPPLYEPMWSAVLIAIGGGCAVAVGCWGIGQALSTSLIVRKLLFGKVR
jgi:fucose 4-O-acetylase-like acetyltransferase